MSFVQKIFYGPPGTGKTWRATREAVRVVDQEAYDKALASPNPDASLAQEHKRLVRDGLVVWVTFHPSYSYEDFLEGYRPALDRKGRLIYEVVDGPFKQICTSARADIDFKIGEYLRDSRGNDAGQVVDKDAGGWLIRIKPDRTDEVAPQQYKYVSRLILGRFIKADLPPEVFSIPGKTLQDLRDYRINPTDADIPPPDESQGETLEKRIGSLVRRIVAARAQVSSSDLANSSHYGSAYRRLIELQNRGAQKKVAIVIDEINRADLARVFGELFTLLEYDKREGMAEEKKVLLPYSKASFSIPSSVSVIGTMNTADRSVAAMDFAMRRRFEFELVDVDPTQCPADYGGINLQQVLTVINKRISILLGPDYRIGHASLMRAKLDSTCERLGWQTKDNAQLRTIAHVWRTYVIPTLVEYFHADWRKARAVAGFARTPEDDYELFESIKADDSLLGERLEEQDLAEARSFETASWWNANGGTWNADKFGVFLAALARGG